MDCYYTAIPQHIEARGIDEEDLLYAGSGLINKAINSLVLIGIIAVCSLEVSRRNSKFETGEQAILSLGKRLMLSCGVHRRRFVNRRHGPTISAFPLSAQREISLRLAGIDYLAFL